MIEIKNLHKYYNKGKKSEQHVLNNINLTLDNKGLVCILGESGSGKTTLLNTIGGLDTFSGGSIKIDDVELTKYDPKKIEPIRNDRFDYIFQNYYLLQDYTVAYNVKLALNRFDISEEEKDERVDYVLNMLGIGKYKKKLVSKLSGGQQQRVSIARALVKSPDIILADEPTGNLDEENTIRTMSILKSIAKDCLVILVTHEKRIAKFFADRIIEVSDGKVIRDEINEQSDSYIRSDDSNIYLKELDNKKLENDLADFKIYYGKDETPEKIELNLAWKDGKLYIQNNMNCDILIEGMENGVQMLDEERPKFDMDDVEKVSYNLSKMKSKGKASLPARQIFKMALENIKIMGKKQAFIMVILIVTAVLLSITTAEFIDTKSIDKESVVTTDSHYVKMDFTKVSSLRSEEQNSEVVDFIDKYFKDDTHGEPFFVPDVSIYLTGQGYEQLSNLIQGMKNCSYVDIRHLDKDKIIYGKMPEKRNEIVMDKQVIEQLMKSNEVVSSLYKNVEDYIGAKLSVATVTTDLVVTGISDTKQPDIYCGQNVLLGFGVKGYQISNIKELQAQYPDKFTDAALKDDEIFMREGLYKAIYSYDGAVEGEEDGGIFAEAKNVVSDRSFGGEGDGSYKIVGTIPDDAGFDYVFSDNGCEKIKKFMMFTGKSCMVYTHHAKETMAYFKKCGKSYIDAFKLDVKRPYSEQLKEYKKAHEIDIGAKNLITVIIVVISMIMVYFMIKSNAVSRSEELTVYRLIGISKGSILKAYMLEMVLLTCYTSLPGVVITSGVIKFVSAIPSLEIGMIFPWWSVIALLACIYLVHMIISILPVYGILSKPPATLAVKE